MQGGDSAREGLHCIGRKSNISIFNGIGLVSVRNILKWREQELLTSNDGLCAIFLSDKYHQFVTTWTAFSRLMVGGISSGPVL